MITLQDLQAAAPTINGEQVEFHDCELRGEQYEITFTWGQALRVSLVAGETHLGTWLAQLTESLTPPTIVLRCEDGSVIAPDGSE